MPLRQLPLAIPNDRTFDLELNFPALLEKAIDWASNLESTVLESGLELTPTQRIDARLAGVKEPARIRLQITNHMPMPEDALLRAANDQVHLITPGALGLTIGYGVIVRAGHEHVRRLLVHEFVHVAQYERMGGMDAFLEEYLTQILRVGYDQAPLEYEAQRRTDAIVGR